MDKCLAQGHNTVTSYPNPLENHKTVGFRRNTGPDPLKITKLPSQHSVFSFSVLGPHRTASEMPFKWRFAGGQMVPRFVHFGILLFLGILPIWYGPPLPSVDFLMTKKMSKLWTIVDPTNETFWIRTYSESQRPTSLVLYELSHSAPQ